MWSIRSPLCPSSKIEQVSLSYCSAASSRGHSWLKETFFPHPRLLPPAPSCICKLIAWRRKWWELHIKAGFCRALLRYLPGRRGWNLPTGSLEGKQTPFLVALLLQYFWAGLHLLPHLGHKDCGLLASLRHFSQEGFPHAGQWLEGQTSHACNA